MISQRKVFTLDQYTTCSGQTIRQLRVGYETYGALNAAGDNAILICHYFSGNAHAAGRYDESDPLPGWWDTAIGPGKMFDTDRYFVISSDSLVNLVVNDGQTVTTGPATIDPGTGRPYGMSFPMVSVTDFVHVQKKLLESLEIESLYAVAGPSGGAAQAFEWAVEYPECVSRVIGVVPPGLAMHPYSAAMVDCWARPILLDPAWKEGRYDLSAPPSKGLTEALRLTTLTAVSYTTLDQQFGEGWADPERSPAESLANEFKADAMLGTLAAGRSPLMDANHFLYMVRAYKLYDVRSRMHRSRASYLLIPVESDLIFPPWQSDAAVVALRAAGRPVESFLIRGTGGHVDGLSQIAQADAVVRNFLEAPHRHLKRA